MLPPKKEARILRRFCEFIGRHDDTAFTYHELLGLLYGLAITPDVIMPEEWLGLVLKEERAAFASGEQVQDFFTAMMAVYNRYLVAFQKNALKFPYSLAADPPLAAIDAWARGFQEALRLRPGCWLEDYEDYEEGDNGPDGENAAPGSESLAADIADLDGDDDEQEDIMASLGIVAAVADPGEAGQLFEHADGDQVAGNPEFRATMYLMLPQAVACLTRFAAVQDEIRRQDFLIEQRQKQAVAKTSTAKTGRNDPCPCGSGKKYKKCCLPKGGPPVS